MSTLLSAQNDISGEIAVLDSLGEYQAGLEALAAKWAEGGHSAVLTANLCGKNIAAALGRAEMWTAIAKKYDIRASMLARLPNSIKSEAYMEKYYRQLIR